MPALQIRDVPEPIRDALADRARQAGQSLNAFLCDIVVREAKFAENARLIDEIDTWPKGAAFTVDDVTGALDEARAE
ncbi:hypothetical protein [Microbacterium sp.]|uniref:FitA-like ribbon-helix-helix domain-containing protein n=1 Tax=Microbacterium sp. TaxID=51671 RepID=UPI00260DDD4F|nr:hypothetical protein [Microbacterium sp.]